jgi:hypothetical protein
MKETIKKQVTDKARLCLKIEAKISFIFVGVDPTVLLGIFWNG